MATFGTFVSGQVLTAAELNSAGEFQTYTPTWTQSATITKTVNWARYTQLNKFVYAQIRMTASSAGTANNKIVVGLPVNASANNYLVGTAWVDDGGVTGNGLPWYAVLDSASTVAFFSCAANQSNPSTGLAGTTNSVANITIASGDIIQINLCYEAA